MKTYEKIFYPDIHYPIQQTLGAAKPLFIDIETTGLKAGYTQIYLIGVCFPVEETEITANAKATAESTGSNRSAGAWRLIQWFAENPSQESALLQTCCRFVAGHDILVHFNGQRFDLPFLQERCRRHHIEASFLTMPSLDLYLNIRPLKGLCRLENCKQKTIEAFLGLGREDLYNGGQLISVYHQYVRSQNEELLQLLLLHNAEDVMCMPQLPAMYAYLQARNGDFGIRDISVTAHPSSEAAGDFLHLCLSTNLFFPKPLHVMSKGRQILLAENKVQLRLPLFYERLLHFFSNYKDYYYLPLEGRCLHKSVAAFVDPSCRRKASPQECFAEREGCYYLQGFPAPGVQGFQRTYEGESFADAKGSQLQDPNYLTILVAELLRSIS